MGRRLGSSAERRLQSFRRDFVLALYMRRGLPWQHVRWIRENRGIAAMPQLPPTLDPGRVHFPPGLKHKGWRWRPEQQQEQREWMVLLHVLHDAVIPDDLRVETPFSSSLEFWMGFLSACVVYDPPPDNLLEFADHGVAAYGDFVNPLHPWADDPETPEMLAPPIRFLPEPEVLYEHVRRRLDRIVDELHEKLKPKGIDIREMVHHLETRYLRQDDDLSREERERDPWATVAAHPYIFVDEHVTEEDVRGAFRMLAAALPARPRPVRPKREPLLCVQCAIWYDACGWSHEQIADHMGWAVQRPAHAKPRSETVRKYIADGRILLNHRKAAA
ncbi:MAG: hypothetical protein M3464_04035 [Chloroflexota bacterium]|nr:hypothetical protein [Chloroflexota bacterium]